MPSLTFSKAVQGARQEVLFGRFWPLDLTFGTPAIGH